MRTYGDPVRRKIRGKRSKTFYIQEYDGVTKRQRWVNTHATSLEAARRFRRRLEITDAEGGRPKEESRFVDAVDRWLEMKRHRMTEEGHRTYSAYAKHWKKFVGASVLVRNVEPRHVSEYFSRRSLDVSNSTLNKERSYLRQFFRWAFDNRLTDDADPVRSVARYQEEDREIRALDADEQKRLLSVCREPYKAKVVALRNAGGIEGGKRTEKKSEWEQSQTPPPWLEPLVRLALWTGLRYGNLAKLQWSGVDLEEGEIKIAARDMKKRRFFRLPLDRRTVEYLRELHANAEALSVLNLPHRRVATRAFERAVERAKVAPCRFHDLRATFISDLGRAGVAIDLARELAGHRSITTTAKHYRQIDVGELREAMEKRADGSKR